MGFKDLPADKNKKQKTASEQGKTKEQTTGKNK